MRGAIAIIMFALAVVFSITHYDPDAHNRIVIDEPEAPVHPAQTIIRLCERRQLPGERHTLNPHAPIEKRRQETINVCVEALPDGNRAPGPIRITTERKRRSIA